MKKTLAILISCVILVSALFAVSMIFSANTNGEVYATTVEITLEDGSVVYLGKQPNVTNGALTGEYSENVINYLALPKNGTMTFDEKTGTLQIEDVSGVKKIESLTGSLVLVVRGNNTVISDSDNAISVHYVEKDGETVKAVGNLTIKGDGSLTASSPRYTVISKCGNIEITGSVTLEAIATETRATKYYEKEENGKIISTFTNFGSADAIHTSNGGGNGNFIRFGGDCHVIAKSHTASTVRTNTTDSSVFVTDRAKVEVISEVKQGWGSGVSTENFMITGGTLDISVSSPIMDTTNKATVGLNVQNGSAKFYGGTVNIKVDGSSDRAYGMFFKSANREMDSVEFAGTVVNMTVTNKLDNEQGKGIIGLQGTKAPDISITGGKIVYSGDDNTRGLFNVNAPGCNISITGGNITGTAKSFIYLQGYNCNLSVTGGNIDATATSKNVIATNTSYSVSSSGSVTFNADATTFEYGTVVDVEPQDVTADYEVPVNSVEDANVATKKDGTVPAVLKSANNEFVELKDGKLFQYESPVYDSELEHKFFATDIYNKSVVLFDLNKLENNNGDFSNITAEELNQCVVWEWKSAEDTNCKKKPGAGIDAAKFRYSSHFRKNVVIATSSNGYAYIIDYDARTVLGEYEFRTENNVSSGPHSVEMLPNGDLVVACSVDKNEGYLAYVSMESNSVVFTSNDCPSGHGVSYDPVNNCLWVLEYGKINRWDVSGTGTATKLIKSSTQFYDFQTPGLDENGHVLSPVHGQPGKYWVAGGGLWMFDSANNSFTDVYNQAASYNVTQARWMKGVAHFADGTMIQTVPKSGEPTMYSWSCGQLRITTVQNVEGRAVPETVNITFNTAGASKREFYKVFPMNDAYQPEETASATLLNGYYWASGNTVTFAPYRFTGIHATLGEDISLTYYADYNSTVRFTVNNHTQVVSGILQEDGTYAYRFDGIAPQWIGDNVKAELLAQDGTVITTKDYSVKRYLEAAKAKEPNNVKMHTLINNLLYYGAAAQTYTGHPGPLVNEGVFDTDYLAYTTPVSVAAKTPDTAAFSFVSANVYFDNVNKIVIKFTTTMDVKDITFKCSVNGGKETVLTDIQKDGTDDVVLTDGIYATGFDDVYLIKAYDAAGTPLGTVRYSVNSYVYAKQDDDTIGALAKATYNYGMAAKNYLSNGGGFFPNEWEELENPM